MNKKIPGVNIQWPWSDLLLSGKKTIETRTYPLPDKYKNVDLAIIETPGQRGKIEAGINSARIVGVIRFSGSFQYKRKSDWEKDVKRHCVSNDNSVYGWSSGKEKWGWVVESVSRLERQIPPPKKRGIIFASKCDLSV